MELLLAPILAAIVGAAFFYLRKERQNRDKRRRSARPIMNECEAWAEYASRLRAAVEGFVTFLAEHREALGAAVSSDPIPAPPRRALLVRDAKAVRSELPGLRVDDEHALLAFVENTVELENVSSSITLKDNPAVPQGIFHGSVIPEIRDRGVPHDYDALLKEALPSICALEGALTVRLEALRTALQADLGVARGVSS
jgi:hypothetical protein